MTDRRPRPAPAARGALSRRALLAAGAAAGAGVVGYLATRQDRATELVAHWRSEGAPEAPADRAWSAFAPFEVALLPQKLVEPMQDEATVARVLLRVIHDGRRIAFHLEWHDDRPDALEAMGRFRDAVAVQLPVGAEGEPPPVTMGGRGAPVHILHWKASWQADVDTGQKGVKDAFPNAFNDVYPEAVLGEAAARAFYPALAVGNPMARRDKTSSVEELVAEGFGTLTTHEQQRATGKAEHREGRWRVVIATPMTGGPNLATVAPGRTIPVALAAWDGGRADRGGRKQWSAWHPMRVERTG